MNTIKTNQKMTIGNAEFNFSNQAYIMGILNVTPDSFSDGGQFNTIEEAVKQAIKMVQEGATIIDVGGESTRPGHKHLEVEEEISRVVPVIEALVKVIQVPISIDTSKSEVAKAAIEAGASMINDVWGFKKDHALALVAAKYNVPCCLMHNRENTDYTDLISDMICDLKASISIALNAGIAPHQIMIDPGIGFAKSLDDNLKVMKHLEVFTSLGYPLLLGTSRKSMIGLTLDLPVSERLEGTIATTVQGYLKGARVFRVHDAQANQRALHMTMAMN